MSDLSQVTAVILAGGLGTRLHKVVSDRPKAMAEINGKPFLYYLLDQLVDASIEKIVISTGYMGHLIEETIGSSYKRLQVEYSPEEIPLGTAGALKLAGQAVDTEQCLVMNGDSYMKFDPLLLLMNHKKSDGSITIVIKKVEDSSRYGTIQMNEQNKIIKFMEKGIGNELHAHRDQDGYWFILGGRARFHGLGDEILAEAGVHEGVFVPHGNRYWFESVGDEPLQILRVSKLLPDA